MNTFHGTVWGTQCYTPHPLHSRDKILTQLFSLRNKYPLGITASEFLDPRADVFVAVVVYSPNLLVMANSYELSYLP